MEADAKTTIKGDLVAFLRVFANNKDSNYTHLAINDDHDNYRNFFII